MLYSEFSVIPLALWCTVPDQIEDSDDSDGVIGFGISGQFSMEES